MSTNVFSAVHALKTNSRLTTAAETITSMATPQAKRTNEANEPQTSESECDSDTQRVELNLLYESVKFNVLFITSDTY